MKVRINVKLIAGTIVAIMIAAASYVTCINNSPQKEDTSQEISIYLENVPVIEDGVLTDPETKDTTPK